ncbi:hypothetical protein [Paracoccus sp. (in: a-proteobacteria)]|uniref:hypothetical protein n=1 Tax=Paracoccus sp. TaxID=267 RepID=UPI00272D62A6|nr:hypothetical protein [Paracoccus sp. (in: a-proteobacteria)]
MANRFLGEATTTLNDVRYTLRCDFNAMCEFEEETGRNALTAFEQFESGGATAKDMRAMMRAFLVHHHPDATPQLAGEIMSADIDVLMRVIQAASPEPDEVQDLGNAKAKARKAG